MEYTEVSDCRMEQGSLRCDVNVSIRKKAMKSWYEGGNKNLNSLRKFKSLEWEQLRQQKRSVLHCLSKSFRKQGDGMT